MDDAPARSTSTTALAVCVALCALAFIAIPAWELIVPGPFDWHIQTPQFWQGGIEALILVALVSTGFALNSGVSLLVLVALPSALYLRRHAVDASLLVDVLYLEVVIGVGMCARRLMRQPAPASSADYVLAFATGFAIWSVLAWAISAVNLGSPKQLGWLTTALALPAALAGHRPLIAYLWKRVRSQLRADRIWCGMLGAWLLVLFARSRVAIYADAPWYGLRGPYVLVPGHSAYEPLALTSPVYYYPKIYELFLLPLSVLRDYSVIDAMSILMLLMLLLVCRLLMREMATPDRVQLPLLALVATLPAFANISTSPTPDVFSSMFVILAALFALKIVRQPSAIGFAWMISAIAIGCSGKLTAIPFCGMLLVATLVAAALGPGDRAIPDEPQPSAAFAWLTFAVATVAALFVHARTLLLAGLPTIGPDPLFKLWLALGFKLKDPVGTLNWTNAQNWRDVPSLLFDGLFAPQQLTHIIIMWTGNVWLWFGLIVFAGALIGRKSQPAAPIRWPLIGLMVTGVGLAVGNRYLVRGGDGHYFLAALVPAILCGGTAAWVRVNRVPVLQATILACIPAFALFQATYSFASGSWSQGTRSFDLAFSKSARDTRTKRMTFVDYYGLSQISDFLGTLPRNARITGAIEPALHGWLPARYEDLGVIRDSRPEYTREPASIRHWLRTQHIDALILPLSGTLDLHRLTVALEFTQTAEQLASIPGVHRLEDRRYYLLDLRDVAPMDLDPPDSTAEPRIPMERQGRD
ncbi:MAG: hypothetical protein ABIR62_13045 [Dokdonella sp.]|uniref:hypothetical protein n=1 Tax=Dokdonella sp. TaxID=2291710 RepID=UPI003265A452